ncbi:hypothetical protein C5167_017535 [Papaver somniferum]|uniref:Uncharacterized protein n=1 Tax=Papaver somniferum TaxID=3469 RepID=A0A4Y7INQ0_PAPSO|nr:uncharacterized protein LOC113347330 [Papaver somniferum]RZC49109.1 hypothetical protein C5167_017535 [Papaver somniferum]
MSASSQNLLTNPRSSHPNHNLCFYCKHHKPNIQTSTVRIPILNLSIAQKQRFSKNPLPHFKFERPPSSLASNWPIRAYNDSEVFSPKQESFNFDVILSIAEVLCLIPSAILSIGFAINWGYSKKSLQELVVNNKVFVWQFGLLIGAVFIGTLIRRRQWSRIVTDSVKSRIGPSFNLLERIEKLEEDLKSSATIIRVLSRQLEKLGIRFRVTRKALKEPISEAAALAQKNSEATRELAAHEDHLEKELGEIQKVLLAMQEQQQKQLELILAIMNAGKPREMKREFLSEEDTREKVNSEKRESKQMKTQMKIDKHDIERV